MESETVKKPPAGIKTPQEHHAQRVRDILNALRRYILAELVPPVEWVDELRTLTRLIGPKERD